MAQSMGEENMFVFGLRADAVAESKRAGHDARRAAADDVRLQRVLDAIADGAFSPDEPQRYRGLVDGLLNHDTYLLTADFGDYVATQGRVDALWRDPAAWAERAIRNVAAMGPFSSDRTVGEYADKVWTAPVRP
jgi:starch phosphorylase